MTSKRSYSLWSFWFYKNKMVNLVQLNKCELKVTFSECVAAVAPSDPCNLIKAMNRFTLLCSVSKSVEPMANIYFHCAVVWLMCLTSLAHVELRLYSTSAPETRIPPPIPPHTTWKLLKTSRTLCNSECATGECVETHSFSPYMHQTLSYKHSMLQELNKIAQMFTCECITNPIALLPP